MRRISAGLTGAVLAVAMAACTSAEPAPAPPAAAQQPAEPVAAGPADGCPLDVADLSAATSLTWELQQTLTDRPLETLPSVTATVCLFTSADSPQFGGDPLVLRVDAVDGADAGTLRNNFEQSCTGNGGAVEDSAGVARCRRDGSVVEGNVATDGRSIDVYLVNADAATATALTPGFDEILGSVR